MSPAAPLSSALSIRPMRAGDDLDAELDLRHRSFGPMSDDARARSRAALAAHVGSGRQFGAWSDGEMIGSAKYYDMLQYWHGRPVPMAGVGGVMVAPEARGRGVGKAMMTGMLTALAGQGYALSTLYPATAHIYRSLGWELAGGNYSAEVPGRTLGSLLPPDPQVPAGRDGLGEAPADAGIRRAVPDDAGQVVAVLGAVHAAARDCGPVTRDEASVRRWIADPALFAYLADDGFLAYRWHGDTSKAIMIEALQARSAGTARALWGIVASHASVTEVVHATVGPNDPVSWLTREPDVGVTRLRHWMLRVIDPVAAVSGRGFPAATDASAVLDLADATLPGNAGRYTLTVSAGRGSLSMVATGPSAASPSPAPVALGPRGFAALYAGVPMTTLRAAGLAVGGDLETDAALDAVFGCQSFMLDYF
ncbi:MAG TPA: GNAT family N-acetyltransferase [Streptosporangiaceae bacterium]|nr:GNAT family N-acetyltransferase [Streptosporangiaceae bacterium]